MLADTFSESVLGQGIRNGFGLWAGNKMLLQSCGSEDMNPDEASQIIIEALKKHCAIPPPPSSVDQNHLAANDMHNKILA
jgi:hypothetical protein